MQAATLEVNFDGIVGPSHNYAGLAYGNVASATHKYRISHPRAAALEGLDKMRRVAELGIPQAVLPPLRRPRWELLRACGFSGEPAEMLAAAGRTTPELLAACYSASNMWTANAATVSPSVDCGDGRVHLTVANLTSTLHRAIEAESTYRNLRFVFGDPQHFVVHRPLPAAAALSDEGAANHTRLHAGAGPGLELFVYGRVALGGSGGAPQKYPARQTLEACQAIARSHQLRADLTLFWQQTPAAIDAGVFHNDVIAVGNRNVLLVHEHAFVEQAVRLDELRHRFHVACGESLIVVEIRESELPLADAVRSYLFNSQLLTCPDGSHALVCPRECFELPAAARCVERILAAENPIERVIPVDLRQSMQNGGGPACLRLRVELTPAQRAAIPAGVWYSSELHRRLAGWIERHYRPELAPSDLMDPALPSEIDAAFYELSDILEIPADVLRDWHA